MPIDTLHSVSRARYHFKRISGIRTPNALFQTNFRPLIHDDCHGFYGIGRLSVGRGQYKTQATARAGARREHERRDTSQREVHKQCFILQWANG